MITALKRVLTPKCLSMVTLAAATAMVAMPAQSKTVFNAAFYQPAGNPIVELTREGVKCKVILSHKARRRAFEI